MELGSSFIYQCKCEIFPTEKKVVPWHRILVAVFSPKRTINSISADINLLNAIEKLPDDAECDEECLYRAVRQVTILPHMQATTLACCQSAELMTIETHQGILERWCFMTVQGILKILPGNPFLISMAYSTAKQVSLQEFLIFAIATNAPTCIVHKAMTYQNLWRTRKIRRRVRKVKTNTGIMLFTISHRTAAIHKSIHTTPSITWTRIRMIVGERTDDIRRVFCELRQFKSHAGLVWKGVGWHLISIKVVQLRVEVVRSESGHLHSGP